LRALCRAPSCGRALMSTYENVLVPNPLPPESDALRRAVAAYLAWFKGQSRFTPSPTCART